MLLSFASLIELQLTDSFFHLLTRLKGYDKLFRNIDAFSRAGIARFPCGSLLDLEHAEVPQLNAVLFNERFDDGFEGLLHDFFGLELGHPNRVRNRFNNVFLRHD